MVFVECGLVLAMTLQCVVTLFTLQFMGLKQQLSAAGFSAQAHVVEEYGVLAVDIFKSPGQVVPHLFLEPLTMDIVETWEKGEWFAFALNNFYLIFYYAFIFIIN